MTIFFIICFLIIGASVFYLQKSSDAKLKKENEFKELMQKRREIAQSIQDDFDAVGWDLWSSSTHLIDGQEDRMKRAMTSDSMALLGYDPDTGRATVLGERGIPYSIDKYGCSCPDFIERQFPCKHMYFAVMKLAEDLQSD